MYIIYNSIRRQGKMRVPNTSMHQVVISVNLKGSSLIRDIKKALPFPQPHNDPLASHALEIRPFKTSKSPRTLHVQLFLFPNP
jgi:hypothetical protein